MPVRALERGDRQRRLLPHTIAIASNGAPVHVPELPKPLIEQDTGRHETQGAQPRTVHGGKCQPGLAAPGRQGNNAAAAPELPGRQGRLLVGAEVNLRPRLTRGARRRRDVLESRPALEEPVLEGPVAGGGRPMRVDARIPQNTRRPGEIEVPGRIGQHDGAPVEAQLHTRYDL